jgi:electron transfer flavoprotein beta subunit
VVLVKHVPDGGPRFGADLLVDRDGDGLLSEPDEVALAAARRLADAWVGPAPEVVALTMGPPEAVATLRRAVQLGADRAVHVRDAALRGSDATATARVLAAATTLLGPVDAVLAGTGSEDAFTGLVPALVAAELDLPYLSHVRTLALGADVVVAERDEESVTTLEADLPAVVSLTDRAERPAYPTFARLAASRRAAVETLDLADLGLDPATVGSAGSRARVTSAVPVPRARSGGGRVVVDSDGDAGAELAAFLLERVAR